MEGNDCTIRFLSKNKLYAFEKLLKLNNKNFNSQNLSICAWRIIVIQTIVIELVFLLTGLDFHCWVHTYIIHTCEFFTHTYKSHLAYFLLHTSRHNQAMTSVCSRKNSQKYKYVCISPTSNAAISPFYLSFTIYLCSSEGKRKL